MLKIIKADKIYVFCPANIKTGGPELLHQLVYTLNLFKKNAYIVYTGINNKQTEIEDEYKQYISSYLLPTEVEDRETNIAIVPETMVLELKRYSYIQKAIWWLSVDNFFMFYKSLESFKYRNREANFFDKIKAIIRYLQTYIHSDEIILSSRSKYVRSFDYHLCQSQYALFFCKRRNYKNVVYLSDYLNDDFFTNTNIINKKENIVVYNPKKGYSFTKKIIQKNPDVLFIPIQNMTRIQVYALLNQAKVYIDFGNHPGMDRLPREACMLGCIVITGNLGSAAYYQDVPLNKKYKFKNNNRFVPKISIAIHNALINYEEEYTELQNYREMICKQKNIFLNDVRNVFNCN